MPLPQVPGGKNVNNYANVNLIVDIAVRSAAAAHRAVHSLRPARHPQAYLAHLGPATAGRRSLSAAAPGLQPTPKTPHLKP